MQLPVGSRVFCSYDGGGVVYVGEKADQLFISSDRKVFFEVKRHVFTGTPDKHDIIFYDPHVYRYYSLQKDGGIVHCNNKVYFYTQVEGVFEVERIYPLPPVRQPEHLFQLPNGEFIYISGEMYRDSPASLKFFYGAKEHMRELLIHDVAHSPDIGITIIKTGHGKLFIPDPSDHTRVPHWSGVTLRRLDASEYDIFESPDGVRISEGIA